MQSHQPEVLYPIWPTQHPALWPAIGAMADTEPLPERPLVADHLYDLTKALRLPEGQGQKHVDTFRQPGR